MAAPPNLMDADRMRQIAALLDHSGKELNDPHLRGLGAELAVWVDHLITWEQCVQFNLIIDLDRLTPDGAAPAVTVRAVASKLNTLEDGDSHQVRDAKGSPAGRWEVTS